MPSTPGTLPNSTHPQRGLTLPQDIQVAIIRAHFEEHVARAVPLIQNLLHQEGTLIEPEPHRPLIRLPARVALHANAHPTHYVVCQTQECTDCHEKQPCQQCWLSFHLNAPANIQNPQ
jgi:hypothetical protein